MIEIAVQTGQAYSVWIETGLFSRAGMLARQLSSAGKVFLLADDNVFALYGQRLLTALAQAGFASEYFSFPPGETSKNLRIYGEILHFLANGDARRGDLVMALGGGVSGDLAGFAAATYLRGLAWMQIPTTLLAMVDASTGGKTAVNLPQGKNLVGVFHQPLAVLCDPALLQTLPEEELKNGWGELIKTAMLDAPLFAALEKEQSPLPSEELIARAIRVKADLVAADEKDYGPRRLLNLGHSFGHAIEAASGYRIPHGQAVAMGLWRISRIAVGKGLCPRDSLNRLSTLLHQHHLEAEAPYSNESLLSYMRQDKKSSDSGISLIIPREIGRCCIETLAWEALPSWLNDKDNAPLSTD